MKPNKTFKLTKTSKRLIALSKDTKDNRTHLKHAMIQAELAAAVQPKREKSRKETPSE
jgi:hypothetical protein